MAKKKEKPEVVVNDRTAREISGIVIILLGALCAVALISSKAPALAGMVRVFRSVFGIGIYAMPALFVLGGLYVIGMKRALGKLALNAGIVTLWIAGAAHLAKFHSTSEMCFSQASLIAGGGILAGYPVCVINSFFGPAAGALLLAAAAVIYIKVATGVSYLSLYEAAAQKLSPVTNSMKGLLAAGFQTAYKRCGDTGREMAETRRARLEAMRAEQQERREENNRRLMEEIKALTPTGAPAEKSKDKKPADVKQLSLVDDDPFEVPQEEMEEAPKAKRSRFRRQEPEEEKTEMEPVPLPPPAEPAVAAQLEIIPQEQPEVPPVTDEEQIEVLVTSEEGTKAIIWKLPQPDDWLDPIDNTNEGRSDTTLRDKLEATLKSFQVPATISNVVEGASFTRFEVTLEPGVKVSRIITLENDIALSLAADSKTIRIEAPIPGKSAIGIEVPNKERGMVQMRKIYMSDDFQNRAKGVLTFVMGEDITGVPVWTNLVKMPHLLVAGSTNSGKSVCVNCIISSIIARQYPEDVRFIMMDMKRVELTPYEGIPHLLTPVIKEADVAGTALKWICDEMDRRYRTFAEVGVRNIDGFNSLQEKADDKLYRIVVVIDELADLMMVALPNMNVEYSIGRITQLARATGIHMILATQRPDTKVITGTIKNNIPTRISFAVPTQIDSRTILDQKGAESLLGRGDMLYMPVDSNRLARLQGAFVSDKEVKNLVDFWKGQQIVVEYPLKFKGPEVNVPMSDSEFISEDEALYRQAVEIVVSTKQASISMIQRRLRIGYNRAARLVELMEERGVVGPYDGSNPREVLLTQAGFKSSEY